MNDRLRFRVWYNPQPAYDDYPKMLYGAEKTYDFMRTPDLIPADSFGELLEDKDFIVMQSTGLKDKNGKLIYEGDIIKSNFDFITNAINPLRFNIGNVIYSDYIAGFVIASDINDYSPYKTSFLGTREALTCIVIGNIYENKELLNE